MSQGKPLERQLSIAEAAEITGFGRTTIKDAMAARELGFWRYGKARNAPVRIPESELRSWFEAKSHYSPRVDR